MNTSKFISHLGVAVVVCASTFSFSANAEIDAPLLPLSEVKPGMTGEWHTVVSGTRIDSFPMQVVGIAENFIGPQRPVIICKALDATNKLTGPVAGMSGSPVFIDGKLIGAYAYGFTWPKDQAIIGVTPIESMMEVETNYPPTRIPTGEKKMAQAVPGSDPQWLAAPIETDLPSLAALESTMRPLPTPIFVSGISQRVLDKFRPQLDKLGVQFMLAPAGSASHSFDTDLKPGSPVAGVLMSGDFDLAGTGTVTWRNGNRILAFGHPFLQSGPTEMPMAPAEILTVIQSVQRSFKLSNTGPIIGTIYQDRLTAIAGEIGRKPDTTHFEVNLHGPGGKQRTFQGELFQNQMMSPTIAAMSLEESIEDTMESEEKQTIYLDTELKISGRDPVKLSDVSSGEDAAFPLVMRELQMYDALLSNPCQFPNVKSLTFNVHIVNGWKLARLDSLDVDRTEVKPGSVLHAVIGLRNFRGEASSLPISVSIPADLDTGEVQLFVGDADAALRMEEPPRVPPQTLDQVLDRIRRRRSHHNIYVKILQNVPGVSLEGQNLPDLPPSVIAQFESPNAHFQKASLSRVTLWETNFPVAGTFSGQITLPVRIK